MMIRRWWHRLMGLLVPRPVVPDPEQEQGPITVVRVPQRSYWINERGVFVKNPPKDPVAPSIRDRLGPPR